MRDLTFVMPTCGRPGRLRRTLCWLADADARVVVTDASEHADADAGDVPGVSYLHRPGVAPPVRIREVLATVRTPYVALCADDDLVMPETAAACVTFLDERSDHVAAQGRHLFVETMGGAPRFHPGYLLSTTQVVAAEDAVRRIAQAFRIYHQWTWAVHRTETLVDVYDRLVPEHGITNWNLVELLLALVAASHGRLRVLPRLYAARESIPASSGVVTPAFADIVNDPAHADQLQRFLRAAILWLMTRAALDEEAAKAAVTEALDGYLTGFLPELHESWRQPPAEQEAKARGLGGFPAAGDPVLDRIRRAFLRTDAWSVVP